MIIQSHLPNCCCCCSFYSDKVAMKLQYLGSTCAITFHFSSRYSIFTFELCYLCLLVKGKNFQQPEKIIELLNFQLMNVSMTRRGFCLLFFCSFLFSEKSLHLSSVVITQNFDDSVTNMRRESHSKHQEPLVNTSGCSLQMFLDQIFAPLSRAFPCVHHRWLYGHLFYIPTTG